MASSKVAIITGGASGFGFGVAQALIQTDASWQVHLLDLNQEAGDLAASQLGDSATFHQVNVTDWTTLSTTFHSIFTQHKRLDFVFGNAGVVERYDLYAAHPVDEPLPEPDMSIVDVNLKAVYATTYLALHYFRHSPTGVDKNIVLTASSTAFYGAGGAPMYAGCKHGVVGFMRSIAARVIGEGIRVNAIGPGAVKTGLLPKEYWEKVFPPEVFIDMSYVTGIVLDLVRGEALTDAKGNTVDAGQVFGRAVEISVNKFYFREQPDFCDEAMAKSLSGAITGKRD